jgi:hypothetical protein
MWMQRFYFVTVVLSLSAVSAQGKVQHATGVAALTPEQTELVEKSFAREKVTIEEIQKHIPLVQTYIQNTRPDAKLYAVPTSDEYMLNRVDFAKAFTAKPYKLQKDRGFFKGSANAFRSLGAAFKMTYSSTGFMDMMFIDPTGYDRAHYEFAFVRSEFLGEVRTQVFDVHAKPGNGSGRFVGRVWIEDRDGNVVRFNGSYTRSALQQAARYWVHFDSWRNNIQPDVWLPVAIYAEEEDRPEALKPGGFRAQTHFWGYSLKLPTHETQSTSVVVDNATDQSEGAQDVSPLEAQRDWYSQAEQNVLDRLVEAGLVAAPSDFDKTLEQVTNNLILGSKLVLAGEIHCRVLLTTPLESLAVGNTILVSKGLVDVLPSEEDLAAVLSFQLAQIVLGHQIDARYAFDDRLLFPDEATFQQIRMNHSEQDDLDSAKKAVELLHNSIYQDKLRNVGLFLAQLQVREKNLSALMTPRMGDSMVKRDGTAWLSEVSKEPAQLDVDNLGQIAALPLGSHLRIDAWDDKVHFLNVKGEPILNAREKMPLELTPIYFRLSRYGSGAHAGLSPAENLSPTADERAPYPPRQ